jgi:hypothetical protein
VFNVSGHLGCDDVRVLAKFSNKLLFFDKQGTRRPEYLEAPRKLKKMEIHYRFTKSQLLVPVQIT